MEHGDIRVRVGFSGEPQKLVTYWRGSLRHVVPVSASITILRARPARQSWYWWRTDQNFYFEAMTRTEKKRAELSISDKSLYMQPGEIARARELTEVTFNWLSGRKSLPDINQPIHNARLSLGAEGGVELIDVAEAFGDPEIVGFAGVGPIYLQGVPRRPDVRWLPDISSVATAPALAELAFFENSLADGQGEKVRDLVGRIARIFKKRLLLRRAKVNKRISEVLGVGASITVEGRSVTDEMLEGYRFREILDYLDREERGENKKDKIRSWRAS